MKKYLLLLLLPIIGYANIGKITTLKGEVIIERNNQKMQVFSGTILEKNDFITTGKHAKIQIVFTDKTIFTVGNNSTLKISDYLYDETQPKKNKADLRVLKGVFSSITGRIGKLNKSKFKLRTKSASIGIRGTIIKASQTVIMCTQGAITVTTNNGVSIDLEAGEKTDVSSGTPTKPEIINTFDTDIFNIKNKLRDDIDSNSNNTPTENNEVSIEGIAIDEDGNVDNITINGKVKNNKLTIDDKSFQKYDESGNLTSDNSLDTLSWGKWNNNPTVVGQKTAVNIINNLRDNTTTVNSTYNGQVLGNVKLASGATDNIKIDGSNSVQLNFQLGNNLNKMSGNIQFQTQAGANWNANFSGTTSSNNFQTTSISNNGSNIISTGSNLSGSFYGDNAQKVGGSFILNNADLDKATGVFKATK